MKLDSDSRSVEEAQMDEMGIWIGHVFVVSGASISGVNEEQRTSAAVQFGALIKAPAVGSGIFGRIKNLRTETGTDGRERRLFDIQLPGETVKRAASSAASQST